MAVCFYLIVIVLTQMVYLDLDIASIKVQHLLDMAFNATFNNISSILWRLAPLLSKVKVT
jgi:hypothetical protein